MIELADYENGSPIMVKASSEVADQFRALKANKNYGEIYQLTKSMPNNRNKYLMEANALMHLKKWKELAACCERGLEVEECADLYNLKGKAVGKLGNNQEKLQLTQKAVEINAKIPAYHRNIGAAYYKLNRYEEAILAHDGAIKLEPKNPINYHNKGAAYFRLKKLSPAKQCFRKAVDLDHKQVISHSWLGDCEKQAGNFAEAKAHYRIAYEISGSDVYKTEMDNMDQKSGGGSKGGIRGFVSNLFR